MADPRAETSIDLDKLFTEALAAANTGGQESLTELKDVLDCFLLERRQARERAEKGLTRVQQRALGMGWDVAGAQTRHFEELEYTVIAYTSKNPAERYSAGFDIYGVAGVQEDGEVLYDDPITSDFPVLDKAHPVAHLWIKWDACSHLDLEPDSDAPTNLHICGREHAEQFGAVLLACFDWAKELMAKKWND